MRRAFTLFELILVMAVLVLLAALSYPSLEGLRDHYQVQGAADTLRGTYADARAHALEEGRAYRVGVVLGKGNYRVAPDSADFWSGSTPGGGEGSTPAYVHTGALPKGIPFRRSNDARADGNGDTVLPADSVDPSQWSTLAVFLPDGTAKEDVDVTLEMTGTRPLIVRLRALTGGVRTLQEGRR